MMVGQEISTMLPDDIQCSNHIWFTRFLSLPRSVQNHTSPSNRRVFRKSNMSPRLFNIPDKRSNRFQTLHPSALPCVSCCLSPFKLTVNICENLPIRMVKSTPVGNLMAQDFDYDVIVIGGVLLAMLWLVTLQKRAFRF